MEEGEGERSVRNAKICSRSSDDCGPEKDLLGVEIDRKRRMYRWMDVWMDGWMDGKVVTRRWSGSQPLNRRNRTECGPGA